MKIVQFQRLPWPILPPLTFRWFQFRVTIPLSAHPLLQPGELHGAEQISLSSMGLAPNLSVHVIAASQVRTQVSGAALQAIPVAPQGIPVVAGAYWNW